MNYGTILRIRQALIAHGMPHAVALFKQVQPFGSPADFCAFILGKSAKVRT